MRSGLSERPYWMNTSSNARLLLIWESEHLAPQRGGRLRLMPAHDLVKRMSRRSSMPNCLRSCPALNEAAQIGFERFDAIGAVESCR